MNKLHLEKENLYQAQGQEFEDDFFIKTSHNSEFINKNSC
jgi:hypothetical protein